MTKEYQPSQEDIDSVLRHLRLTDPEHATAEWAVIILRHMYATLDRMSFENPELLDRVIENLKKNKQLS